MDRRRKLTHDAFGSHWSWVCRVARLSVVTATDMLGARARARAKKSILDADSGFGLVLNWSSASAPRRGTSQSHS